MLISLASFDLIDGSINISSFFHSIMEQDSSSGWGPCEILWENSKFKFVFYYLKHSAYFLKCQIPKSGQFKIKARITTQITMGPKSLYINRKFYLNFSIKIHEVFKNLEVWIGINYENLNATSVRRWPHCLILKVQ